MCSSDLLMGNNGNMWDDCNVITGTFKFNGYPTFDEWNSAAGAGARSQTAGNGLSAGLDQRDPQ